MEYIQSLSSIQGRIGRLQWWIVGLILVFMWTVYLALAAATVDPETGGIISGPMISVFPFMLICSFWLNLAAIVKRYHDRDKSGWWFFIGFIPFVGSIWQLIELGFLAGRPGANSYGSGPTYTSGGYDELAGYDLRAMREHFEAQNGRGAAPMARAAAPASRAVERHAPMRPAAPAGFGRRGV